jgi:hypothetical protein
LAWPHGDCAGPRVPCPACNATSPPQSPPDFVSLLHGAVDYDAFLVQPRPQARLSPGQRGELLFEFARASDRAPIRCELRFNGESYGWEAQFLEQGELLYARGTFPTKALAIQWATEERKSMETSQ